MRVGRGLFGWVLFITLAIMLVMLLKSTSQTYQKVAWSDFESLLHDNRVKEFTIDGDEIKGEVKDNVQIPGAPAGLKLFDTEYPAGTFQTARIWLNCARNGATPRVRRRIVRTSS